MFDKLRKPKFYVKCKSLVQLTKTRLEMVRKKKNAVYKFLKSDIADLLKSRLDYNAFGRTEGLLNEQKRLTCYDFIEQFYGCIANHLSLMQKQRECPEECREAVFSLIYAAARISEIPELRNLRALFTERYGSSLELFVNQEFAETFKSEPPSKEMKLQLLHDIAKEFSIEWDSKALEQKLFKPPLNEQCGLKYTLNNTDDDRYKRHKSKNDSFQNRDSQDARREYAVPKENKSYFTSHGRKSSIDDKNKLQSSSEDEAIDVLRRDSTDQDSMQSSSSSVRTFSEDEEDSRKPFYYKSIPPPYIKRRVEKDGSSPKEQKNSSGDASMEKITHENDSVGKAEPKPKSVRRKFLKPPPGRENVDNGNDEVAKINSSEVKQEEARKDLQSVLTGNSDERDEEEKIMDGQLMYYSKKHSPYELGSKENFNLKPPPSRQTIDGTGSITGGNYVKSESFAPPTRTAYVPPQTTTPAEARKGQARATSLQPKMLPSHAHSKLPDYDELAARFEALKGS